MPHPHDEDPLADRSRVDRRTRSARGEHRAAREALLDAALRVFARHGYNASRVDQITAEAGYSKGALYWHFTSKEELLSTLLEERVDTSTRLTAAFVASAPPDQDMALEAVRQFARLLNEQRDAIQLDREYWTLAIRDPDLRTRYTARQTELRNALATAFAARARHLGSPELSTSNGDIARIVMAVIAGLTVDELVEPGSVDPALLGEALAIIYAGLVVRAR